MLQKYRWYLTPTLVFLLSMLSLIVLLWIFAIQETQRVNYDISDAVMDIQLRAASAHLGLEEAAAGDAVADPEKALADINLAISLAQSVLHGGRTEHDLPLQPVRDPALRTQMEEVHYRLIQFRKHAFSGIDDSNVRRIEVIHDRDHDEIYKNVQSSAAAVELALETAQIRSQTDARHLFWLIFFVWTVMIASTSAGIWNRESRRRNAEAALARVNQELKVNTQELQRHREHLVELVDERTDELKSANAELRKEVAERKRVENSLRENEEKTRILVNNLPQKVFLKDHNSTYIYCNDKFAHDFNLTAQQIIGKTDHDLYPREIAEKNIEEDRQVILSGRPLNVDVHKQAGGQHIILRKIKTPTINEVTGLYGILGQALDVTERVRLESAAAAAASMNNLGFVFAGIRHEMGNPINSAKMTLSVLKKKIDTYPRDTILEYLERAMEEISRVQYLLNSLKNFNMYETPEIRELKMHDFMGKFLPLVTSDFEKRGVALETTLSPDAGVAQADPRALQQVLLNVVSNALDATASAEQPRIRLELTKNDGNIRIAVSDNGCGISESQQSRLFKPFFTTKPSGNGLGLVIARKLMTGMNGSLEITSRQGIGTSVEIWIPEGKHDA